MSAPIGGVSNVGFTVAETQEGDQTTFSVMAPVEGGETAVILTVTVPTSILDMEPGEFTDPWARLFAVLRMAADVDNDLDGASRKMEITLIYSSFQDAMKSADKTRQGAIANLIITCVAAGVSLGVGGMGVKYSFSKTNSVLAQVYAQAFGPLAGTLGQLGPAVQGLFSADSQEYQAYSERAKSLAQLFEASANDWNQERQGNSSSLLELIQTLTQTEVSAIRII